MCIGAQLFDQYLTLHIYVYVYMCVYMYECVNILLCAFFCSFIITFLSFYPILHCIKPLTFLAIFAYLHFLPSFLPFLI